MGDRRANAAAEVVAARAALEAALDAEGVSEDAVANLAEQYAVALMKAPGELPPKGAYTDKSYIFAALKPLDGSELPPVRLLRSTWISNRCSLFLYYSPHLVAFLYISMHLCCVNKNSFHYYLVASLICCMLTHSYAYQRLQVVQRGLWGKTLGMRASHLRPARPFGLPRPMRCPLCHLAVPLPTFRRWFERACRRSDLDASASPASV